MTATKPRRSVVDTEVQNLLQKHLVPLYFRSRSVYALTHDLNAVLASDRSEGWLHPNRLHTLLSLDPARSINAETLTTVATAAERVHEKEPPADTATFTEQLRGRVQTHMAVLDHSDPPALINRIATEESLPPAIVKWLLGLTGSGVPHIGGPAPATSSKTAGPDWRYQDDAVRACRAALAKRDGIKVGMILPTGGGKTRVALRIVLAELTTAPQEHLVLWVTHRQRLRTQARRELQEMITAGTPDVPAGAVGLLSHRVRFAMTHDLEAELRSNAGRIALVVIDEAHHAAAPSYQPVFTSMPQVRGLFLTATPNRTDGLDLGIDEIAYYITYRELFARSVIIEPTFDTLTIPHFDGLDDRHLEDLCDYLLDRADTDFVKTLLVTPTIEKTERAYDALLRTLEGRKDHILSADDIGFVHGSKSSAGISPEEFLDEFQSRPRGILVSTSQLLSEGFDDKRVNAVVIAYRSESLIALMQGAGRCLRYSAGKDASFVVQVKDSDLAYHYEQRWLYQEISDLLHPRLIDITYSNVLNLHEQVEQLLREKKVYAPVRNRVLQQLDAVRENDPCRLLLTGLPYSGDSTRFDEGSAWDAILETEATSTLFRRVFNDHCARGARIKDLDTFLEDYLEKDLAAGSMWRSLMNMLNAMQYAHREVFEEQYEGARLRGYVPRDGTTWLSYITFRHAPAVPAALQTFLADCCNKQETITAYTAEPEKWQLAVKIPVPSGDALAFLLDRGQNQWFETNVAALRQRVLEQPGEASFAAVVSWRYSLRGSPVSPLLLDHLAAFIPQEAKQRLTLGLTLGLVP